MVSINRGLAALICVGLLTACAPKKVGAETHLWNVTAQNGDKMVGCLAEDVTPDVLGYIDIEALPDFNITTFEGLNTTYEESRKPNIPYRGLANRSRTHHPWGFRDTREDKIKHCGAYPAPQGATEWNLFVITNTKTTVEYRLFSLGEKMVFIDARIEAADPKYVIEEDDSGGID